MNRSLMINNLLFMVGTPYLWDGWGLNGTDCSGLQSYALDLPIKYSAKQLHDRYKNNAVEKAQAAPGTLFFYGANGVVDHVMSVLRHWPNGGMVLIGACHGDSTTTTLDRARQQGAFVMTQPDTYWTSAFIGALDPFAGQENI